MFNFISGIRDLFTTQPVVVKTNDININNINISSSELNDIIKISDTNINNINSWYNYGSNWKF